MHFTLKLWFVGMGSVWLNRNKLNSSLSFIAFTLKKWDTVIYLPLPLLKCYLECSRPRAKVCLPPEQVFALLSSLWPEADPATCTSHPPLPNASICVCWWEALKEKRRNLGLRPPLSLLWADSEARGRAIARFQWHYPFSPVLVSWCFYIQYYFVLVLGI